MIDVGVLRRRVLVGVAVVSVLGLLVEVWHAQSHDAVIEVLLPRLSLSYEANLPTWFSSSLLLACAVAAGWVAAAHDAWRRHWWGITAILAWMSLDEAAELHEHLGGHIGTGGALYFDWVIPAAVIVLVLGLVYLPFMRALEERSRRRLVTAAAIYLAGALGMELPLGWWTETYGSGGLGYGLIDWVEETLEMIGATLALWALVAHRQEAARA